MHWPQCVKILGGSLAVALWTIFAGLGIASASEEAICSNPAVFFCDNFEDRAVGPNDLSGSKGGKTLGWGNIDFSGMPVANDEHFDGTRSLKFIYPACSWSDNQYEGCGTGFMGPPAFNPSPNDWYFRHYAKWSSTFTWSAVGTKHFALLTTDGSRRPWLNMRGGGGTLYLEDEPDSNRQYDQNQGNNITFNLNQWYCLEIHVRHNAPGSDLVEVWVDGVLRLRNIDANFGTLPWYTAMLSGYWNTSPTPGSKPASAKWYDNIVMSTQRIGCLGGTPPSNASPPSTPGGVTAK